MKINPLMQALEDYGNLTETIKRLNPKSMAYKVATDSIKRLEIKLDLLLHEAADSVKITINEQ